MERKIKPMNCVVLDRVVDDDFIYGSFEDTDKLVDSENVNDRIRMAKMGYGVDKLKDDADPRVRAAVASNGFYSSQFINDSSLFVRSSVRRIYRRGLK